MPSNIAHHRRGNEKEKIKKVAVANTTSLCKSAWYDRTTATLCKKACPVLSKKDKAEAKARSACLSTSSDKVGVKFSGGAFQADYYKTKFRKRGELCYDVLADIFLSQMSVLSGTGGGKAAGNKAKVSKGTNSNNGTVVQEFLWDRDRHTVNVASFGGGPGTDVAGLAWLQRDFVSATASFDVILFDFEKTWKRYTKTLEECLGEVVAAGRSSCSGDSSRTISLSFRHCDVTKSIEHKTNRHMLNRSNLENTDWIDGDEYNFSHGAEEGEATDRLGKESTGSDKHDKDRSEDCLSTCCSSRLLLSPRSDCTTSTASATCSAFGSLQEDLLPSLPSSLSEHSELLRNLDIVLFFYVCHETSRASRQGNFAFYRDLGRHLKDGSMVVIADVKTHSKQDLDMVAAALAGKDEVAGGDKSWKLEKVGKANLLQEKQTNTANSTKMEGREAAPERKVTQLVLKKKHNAEVVAFCYGEA